MMVGAYLRRGRRNVQRWMLDPRLRNAGAVAAYGGSGFLLSAASIGGFPQPLALGLICANTGWRALVMTLGAVMGYPAFWGRAGNPGIVWSAAAGLLALLVGKLETSREQPLMIPTIAAFLTAVTEVCFLFFIKDSTPLLIRSLRVLLAGLTGILFTQACRCRDPVTDWLAGGVIILALAQVTVGKYFGLGYLAAGMMSVGSAFPAAVVAGLGLDLAQITRVPMAAVLCLSYFVRLIPYDKRWQHYAAPGVSYLLISAAVGIWDTAPLPGLVLGGALGALLPPQPEITRRRGETGAAQVRLELGAEVMGTLSQMIRELEPAPIDEFALLEKALSRACDSCSARRQCQEKKNFTTLVLYEPLEADCRKQGRLIPELRRAQEQLKLLKADRQRRKEYRLALQQQYLFLDNYLRAMADRLPRKAKRRVPEFSLLTGARSREKERSNGDRCIAFPGLDCRYYILLCDGMGTGLGAAQEGHTAADLLRQLLTAGFPAEHSLQTVNNLLALRSRAAAVTMDLAEICLDTGHAHLYKWGAPESWVLTRHGSEKIGTATLPPGLSVGEKPLTVEKLSLRRGEVLILLSDGVDGEDALGRHDLDPDLPPGELAEKLLDRGCGTGDDDATAAVIKLRPLYPTPQVS